MFQIVIVIIIVLFGVILNRFIDPYLVNVLREKPIGNQDEDWYFLRVKKAKFLLILMVAWPSLHYQIYYFVGVLTLSLIVYKIPYLKLKSEQQSRLKQLRFQFPIWLRQLQILIQTNTIVTSLSLSIETAPDLIKEDLNELIQAIEVDAVHLAPYLNFLHSYRLAEVERAMKLLYRYNTVGKDDAYMQFNRMIQTTTKWLRSERLNRNDSKLLVNQWWGMLPLFGVTVLFMAIMFEIMMGMFGKGVT